MNDRRKYFMINLHERMLPTSARVEPATSWSPVGQRIQLSHRGRLFFPCVCELAYKCGNFHCCKSGCYYKIESRQANSVDPDETAYHKPSHLDQHCLPRYLVWSTRLKGLNDGTQQVYSQFCFVHVDLGEVCLGR